MNSQQEVISFTGNQSVGIPLFSAVGDSGLNGVAMLVCKA